MTRWHLTAMVGILLLTITPHTHAGFFINVGDLHLQPGETGFIDVVISSDTGRDLLDTFGVEFRITTSDDTCLEFVDPPTDPQLGDPDYVLAGDSLVTSSPPAGSISSFLKPNDTYIGGDGTISMDGLLIPTTGALLASLEVTAVTANAPKAGDTFTISLEPGPSTFFFDPNFQSISFDSSPGLVRVVPEPCHSVVWCLLAIYGIFTFLHRRRGCTE